MKFALVSAAVRLAGGAEEEPVNLEELSCALVARSGLEAHEHEAVPGHVRDHLVNEELSIVAGYERHLELNAAEPPPGGARALEDGTLVALGVDLQEHPGVRRDGGDQRASVVAGTRSVLT